MPAISGVRFVTDDYRRLRGQLEFYRLAGDMLRMKKRGFTSLSLLGGEPTVHPDIEKIVTAAKLAGYRKILCFTNGQRFADMDFALRLKKAGLNAANVSVHGFPSKIHDSVTGVKGSFSRTVNGITNLIGCGIDTALICVVQKQNYLALPGTMRFYWELGVRRFVLFFMKYQGRVLDDKKRAGAFIINARLAADGVKRAFAFFKVKEAAPPYLEHFPPCVLPGYESRMRDYYPATRPKKGENSACVHPGERIKNVRDMAYKGFTYLPGCSLCKLRAGCQGIDPEYLKLFGSEDLLPVISPPKPFYESWPAPARKAAERRSPGKR